MSALTLYFILMLDKIELILLIVTAISAILGNVVYASYSEMKSCYEKYKDEGRLSSIIKERKIMVRCLVIASISGLLFVLIPDTSRAATIYLLPKIVNNENMQTLPDKVAKTLNLKMDEYINSMIDVKEKPVNNTK
jgi:hypothetical protein